MRTYYTHDNGSRPFKVMIESETATIYKRIENDDDDIKYEKKPIIKFKFMKIFIGKSHDCKTTRKSGGNGKMFDGNSILLKLTAKKYVFIGERIIEFMYDDPIVKFYSPVGNSDVPYPYAFDKDGNCLFILEMTRYDNIKYDTKLFDTPVDFIYFKQWFNGNPERYKKFKLFGANGPIEFRFYRNKYYIDEGEVNENTYKKKVNEMLPKAHKIKFKTLVKRFF